VFPNSRKTGPIWHEDLLSRRIQPVADELGLPHITWRLLRHWGATQMVEARVPLKAAQERLGHSRPDILLKFCAHVLDASADMESTTKKAAKKFAAKKTPAKRAVKKVVKAVKKTLKKAARRRK
jgi:hypothetical protein